MKWKRGLHCPGERSWNERTPPPKKKQWENCSLTLNTYGLPKGNVSQGHMREIHSLKWTELADYPGLICLTLQGLLAAPGASVCLALSRLSLLLLLHLIFPLMWAELSLPCLTSGRLGDASPTLCRAWVGQAQPFNQRAGQLRCDWEATGSPGSTQVLLTVNLGPACEVTQVSGLSYPVCFQGTIWIRGSSLKPQPLHHTDFHVVTGVEY